MTAVLEWTRSKRPAKRWTYEQYCRLDDDQRYELYQGQLIAMSPGPDFDHQSSSGELYMRMKTHANANRLGTVVIATFDVIFDEHNTAQPDVLFVSKGRVRIIQPRGVFGAPDLVVEVVSPFSVSHDR